MISSWKLTVFWALKFISRPVLIFNYMYSGYHFEWFRAAKTWCHLAVFNCKGAKLQKFPARGLGNVWRRQAQRCQLGKIFLQYLFKGGDMAQEVRAVVWQSEGCQFDPTLGVSKCPLSKTPNPQLLLMSWEICSRWAVNERHKLYSALDKGAI